MKVKFDFNLNAWIKGVEIEADSEEQAKEILLGMTFSELLEDGYCKDFSISDVDSYVMERSVTVKAYDITYSIEEDDYNSPEEYNQIINSLPDSLVLTVVLSPEDDLEETIADEITYETNWLVENFRFMILAEN
jgi:hypothetical protein